MFNLPTYTITPSAHPTKCPPSAHHPFTPTPRTPLLPPPLVRFTELGVFMIFHRVGVFMIFPTHFFSLPFYSLSMLFIFPKWMRTYNVCRSLTALFTRNNTLQFHPHRRKWWAFVISNDWVVFHCIHKPYLLYPFIFRWTPRLLPQFGSCWHCCYKHRGAGVPAFHCICIFGVNPQQCNCWVVGQIYF